MSSTKNWWQVAKVSLHHKLAAIGFAAVTTAVSWRVGQYYGWHGHNGRAVDDIAMWTAFVGFAFAALCVVSIPLNIVHFARLAVASLFVCYTYLAATAFPGLSGADRFSRVALYLAVAVAAGAHLIEHDMREWGKRL